MKDFRADPQAGFDFSTNMVFRGGYFLAPLFGIFLISNYLIDKRPVPLWAWAVGVSLPLVGLYGLLRYRLHQTLRVYLLMMDCVAFSSLALMLIAIWNFGLTGKMSWIYREYFHLYATIFVVMFAVPLLRPSNKFTRIFQALEPYYEKGLISAGDFYQLWFRDAGAEQWQKGGKYATLIGLFATGGVVASVLGGREYVLLYSFIAGLLSVPFGMGIGLHRRLLQRRYLSNRDLVIIRNDGRDS